MSEEQRRNFTQPQVTGSGQEKKQFLRLALVLFFAFVSSVAIAIILNVAFPSTSGSGLESSFFAFFFLGSIFFPGRLKKYREARRDGSKVTWYQRLDLLLCLMGVSAGPCFILSVVHRWFEFVLNNEAVSSSAMQSILRWMTGVAIALIFCIVLWLALIVLVLIQGIKQRDASLTLRGNKRDQGNDLCPGNECWLFPQICHAFGRVEWR